MISSQFLEGKDCYLKKVFVLQRKDSEMDNQKEKPIIVIVPEGCEDLPLEFWQQYGNKRVLVESCLGSIEPFGSFWQTLEACVEETPSTFVIVTFKVNVLIDFAHGKLLGPLNDKYGNIFTVTELSEIIATIVSEFLVHSVTDRFAARFIAPISSDFVPKSPE